LIKLIKGVIFFICKVVSFIIGVLIIPILISDVGKVDYDIYFTIIYLVVIPIPWFWRKKYLKEYREI